MLRFANAFAVVYALATLFLAASFGILGANWLDIDIGHGLHPIIAFPMTIICLGLAAMSPFMREWYISLFETEEERLKREFLEMRAALREEHNIHI